MAITIREATLSDVPFVRSLAADSVVWSIPHTRKVDTAQVREQCRANLERLELELHRDDFKILIASDDSRSRPVGYLLLELNQIEPATGEKQAFIFDMAVRQDYWSQRVGHALVEAAASLAAARGLQYMTAQVTAANHRSLDPATGSLGFEIERHQIVRRLMPPGEASQTV
jgi:GNAT superfamily N-acetyltransferase